MVRRRSKPTVATQTIWNDGTTFVKDAEPIYDVLVIRENARVYFKNGIRFKALCNKLVIEKNVFLDGRGSDGVNGGTPPSRRHEVIKCSGDPAQHQSFIHPRYIEFYTNRAYGYFGYDASHPTPGAPGAHIEIRYDVYEGEEFDKKKQANVSGGKGGKGAPGGLGCHILCIPSCNEGMPAGDGRASSDRIDGRPGSFALKRTTEPLTLKKKALPAKKLRKKKRR